MWLPSRYSLRNKVVVISGGSRGLGLAMAREFARHGAYLALLARDKEELERAANDLLRFSARVSTWPCDVKEPHEVEQAILLLLKNMLALTCWSIMPASCSWLHWMRWLKEILRRQCRFIFGPLTMSQWRRCPTYRRNGESRIVNISSIGGRVAVPHMAPYCASKFALAGFSDALRAEVARQGIRVTTVSPGLMRTGSHVKATFKGDYEKEFAWFSVGAGMPFLSMNAERAARQIVEATRQGQPALTITIPARCLIFAQAIMPNLLARILQLVNLLLPKNEVGRGLIRQKGYDSQSAWAPSLLTILADRAAPLFNEGPQPRR